MKILVCDRLEEKVLDKFEELGEITNISESKTKTEDLKSNIVDTEIVVIRSGTKINKDILENANNLKIIARCGVGVDNVDIEEATNKKISVAELTIGLIISAARKIHVSNNSLKDKKWDRNKFLGTELYQKQLGLVGFGKAAKEVAKRLSAFGMNIVFYDPYVDSSTIEAKKVDLDELLKTSDVISIHVVKTEETTNLINNEKLNLIKKGGILVNTSRGGIIDEESLFQKANEDFIFAGLDVFSQEPPDVNETFSKSNIVTTPHLGASTYEAQLKAGLETVQNVSDILNGELSSVLNI